MQSKYVYLFEEGNAGMRDLLGGKGAGLAEMTNLGLPVPPGFIITTEACNEYSAKGELPAGLEEQIQDALSALEKKVGKALGDKKNPLLLSVRSGAKISMPGMMDTVLNLGLNDETVKALAAATGNERFALDCYRRFIQMFSDIVLHVEFYRFEDILEKYKRKYGVQYDHELKPEHLKEIISEYKDIVKGQTKQDFPQDPTDQLRRAVIAVFESWNNPRAKVYRKVNKIPDDLGTAVNVQAMVFGNMGNNCGTGVAFTRDPATGENVVFGEYLINAQGEDVVAGIRTPQPISKLKEEMPEAYEQFVRTCSLLEKHYRDMQDIEFTIENGKLYILQTRSGKRTAAAAVKVAVDMVKEGLISKEEAILRVEPDQLNQVLHKRLDTRVDFQVVATGLPASPGAASGKAIFDANEAERLGNEGEKVILVRTETTPDDIHGVVVAQGVLTSRGGMTSHAAVVARGMGKPCVCGCEALNIDYKEKKMTVGDLEVKEGDVITIDGSTGQVIFGEVPLVSPEMTEELRLLLAWSDEIRKLGVLTNADTPADAQRAREFGAVGIGLCRTEHMFMAQDRLPIVQAMIMAKSQEERQDALDKLLPMQQGDFYGILKAMDGLPVVIRLLDPPLHEFLPNVGELSLEIQRLQLTDGDSAEIAKKQTMLEKARSLQEMNPMLGHRGCRLGITTPEVYAMQARAIVQAVAQLKKEGYDPRAEIMIPLVMSPEELEILRQLCLDVIQQVEEETGFKFEIPIGTMIELPRACLLADEIAKHADFFSFGTNDLTQTTFGFSRDDAEGKFIPQYMEKKILEDNPFAVLDRDGVGKLVKYAVENGRKANPQLVLGICGEHGGDPSSVEFCHLVGLDYVSCSPFRVPIARLAAAQAQIRHPRV
ncbi:MAG: pyruvate, phosphate dikinase [Thermacetogeniaceae bacterium]|jgi:pyruvate,orthophosphate dikinase|nr:pyruvate, phosphate dikinase [Syntrophomonadaceae bacterium]